MNEDHLAVELDFAGVLLDLETTGTVPEFDRVIEVAVADLEADFQLTNKKTWRIYPGVPIPPEATCVNGITDADLEGCPHFGNVAGEIQERLSNVVVIGWNLARFDIPILQTEFERGGRKWVPQGILDVMKIHHQLNPRDLEAAHRQYQGDPIADRHSALGDVVATRNVLQGMILEGAIPGKLAAFHHAVRADAERFLDADGKFEWRFGEPAFTFGKHAGHSLREVSENDRGYLHWMIKQRFDPSTDQIVREALAGIIPRRSEPAW